MPTYYAVNKYTNEHVKFPSASHVLTHEDWDVIEGDDEGWIKVTDGENPLHFNDLCKVKVIGNWNPVSVLRSSDWDWTKVISYFPVVDSSKDSKLFEYKDTENDSDFPTVGSICTCYEDNDCLGIIKIEYISREFCIMYSFKEHKEVCGRLDRLSFSHVTISGVKIDDGELVLITRIDDDEEELKLENIDKISFDKNYLLSYT